MSSFFLNFHGITNPLGLTLMDDSIFSAIAVGYTPVIENRIIAQCASI